MGDTVIQIEHVSKLYRLGVINHGRLVTDIQSWWARLRGKEDPNSQISDSSPVPANGRLKGREDRFWALRDVSLSVSRGERIGIVGRNGAGKSTLLKIVSRITTPTEGIIKAKGRIASLLEVGTGFNPELTGRENVYLNGAILGMRRAEVTRKFDQIVSFAEVEKFIDTPVKRYSSGMYVRLAFSVAAHLEPDILIVDEVLAVGDVTFQQKSLDKMNEVSQKEGRTILFVTHSMAAVRKLCSRALLLTNGHISDDGTPGQIVTTYLEERAIAETRYERDIVAHPLNDISIRAAWIEQEGLPASEVVNGVDVTVVVQVEARVSGEISVDFVLKDQDSNPVVFYPTSVYFGAYHKVDAGTYEARLTFRPPVLAAGRLYIDLIVRTGVWKLLDLVENAFRFTVPDEAVSDDGWRFLQISQRGAVILNDGSGAARIVMSRVS